MTPRPGRSVRGSRTGRPVMALFDLLGRRWALRVLWELRADAFGFRELQARCGGVSPSSLSERLRELKGVGIVEEADDRRQRLSPAGRRLVEALAPVQAWAERWAGARGARR